jgi:hypothetical protein
VSQFSVIHNRKAVAAELSKILADVLINEGLVSPDGRWFDFSQLSEATQTILLEYTDRLIAAGHSPELPRADKTEGGQA